MQKGNEVLKKAKAKSEQIEKKGDKVSVKSVNNSQCVMWLWLLLILTCYNFILKNNEFQLIQSVLIDR